MNIDEAKELLNILSDNSEINIRISIDDVSLMDKIKAANFHVVLESNVWRKAELSVPFKFE